MKKYAIALIMLLGVYSPLSAVLNIVITQSGSDVLVTASGTVNTADLTPGTTNWPGPGNFINPSTGAVLIGAGNVDVYTGASFFSYGTGTSTQPSSTTGDRVGFVTASGGLLVPTGYSGASLSSSATYDDTTIFELGLAPGTYSTTWGSDATADSLILTVVPEPSAYAAIVSIAVLGFVAIRRRRRK